MTAIFTRTWTTPSGKSKTAYRVTFTVNGKKKFRQFTKRKDAAAFVENLAVLRPSLEAPSASPLVRHIAEHWLSACRKGRDGAEPLEDHTIKNYRGHVHNYIVDALGDRPVAGLTKHDFRAFRDDLVTSGLSRSTVHKILGTLQRIVQHAVDLDHLEAHPGRDVRVRSAARGVTPVDVPHPREVAKLLHCAREFRDSLDKRVSNAWKVYYVFLLLLIGTGIRLSEARGLRRIDVLPDRILIRQRADRSGAIGAPKTRRSIRTIYVAKELSEALHAQMSEHTHDLVFPSRTGRPLDPQNIGKRLWAPVCEAAGITGYGIHSLRHYFASRQIAAGQNVKEVSAVLGHADEAFTLRTYTHLFHDDDSIRKRKVSAELALDFGIGRR